MAASLGAAFALGMVGSVAAAQSVERAGAQKSWSVFEDGQGANRVCWIVSSPESSEARRGGRRTTVSRGEIYLMVAARPAQNVRNEISTVIGYEFRPQSTVRVDIGGATFAMFTDGDKAWLENPAADDRMVEAMKKGSRATLTGTSARGTTTIDTYSLSGFTAALEEAQRLCK